MRWQRVALILGAFALPSFVAGAQTPTPSAQVAKEPPIVVEGRLKQAISGFVQRLTQSGPTDQIARWKDEVCPLVLGIDPSEARFMEQRIGELARTVRLRAGGSSCLTTMAVVITSDPKAFIDDLLRNYSITLRADGWDRLKRFVESTRPVRWISATDECGFSCGLAGSRIRKDTRPSLAAMIVVVDANQLNGVNIGELSDYVALVALSNPNDRSSTHHNSMLALFDDPRMSNASFELTDFDRSFLAALYHAPIDRSANAQRAMMKSAMKEQLSKPIVPPKTK
ncbi:MAG TPA: hypothetical protein VHU79_06610 [Sphingomicrobium sp.]|nr:hypothetical protein [Sphingomicrobium sp.]